MVDYRIVVPSGIVFDFNNMLGAGRLQPQEVEQALVQQGAAADKAVCELRRSGFAKKHLSKDGAPEHVYFPRMPYIADGNPNTEQSIIKLMRYSKHLRSKDVVIFLGVGGSYLGNKVLFDAFGGYHWKTRPALRQRQPHTLFSRNHLQPVDLNSSPFKMRRIARVCGTQPTKVKTIMALNYKSCT